MKRLFVCILLLLFISSAVASDLDGLSFDELVSLRDQINLAIWKSQDWQEVDVPVGIWEIGKDIPAGHWLVTPKEGDFCQVFYCEKVDFDTKKPDHAFKYHTVVIASTTNHFSDEVPNSVDYDMKDGWFFINEGPVVFTPYTGKPDLAFH